MDGEEPSNSFSEKFNLSLYKLYNGSSFKKNMKNNRLIIKETDMNCMQYETNSISQNETILSTYKLDNLDLIRSN